MLNDKRSASQIRLLVLSGVSLDAMHHGTGLRAHHLLSRLPQSYKVTVLSAEHYLSPKPPAPSSLNRLRQGLRFQHPYRFDPKFQQTVDRILREQPFDAVLVIGAELLHYTAHCCDIPIIADIIDEPVLAALREIRVRGASMNSLRTAKFVIELLPYLRRMNRHTRHCILISEKDARWFRGIVPGVPVSTLPNGVDSDFFRPQGASVNPRKIAFSGIMGFPPNIAAAKYFASQIFPRILKVLPECQWSIVGGSPSPEVQALANSNIDVTGYVPDLRPYLEEAAVIVSPLVSGGGMKNKILEAWSMEKAVVATPLGCAGIDARDGFNLLVARNADEFAEKVVHLLTHPDEAITLGRTARRTVAEQYSWDEKSVCLDHIIRSTLSESEKLI